jgi:UDP-N-acetylmuramoyl-L-alanyl-D-glutamate--2,6-diaminopimelate ligase
MTELGGNEPVAVEQIRAALERAGQLVAVRGTMPATIAGLTDDSRQVRAGSGFVAVRGSARDGHTFLAAVAAAGAGLVIAEDAGDCTVPTLVVRESRIAAAVAAAAYYGEPARQLTLVGVTGTNGKTTTVHILRHLLDSPAGCAASLGTIGVRVGSEGRPLAGGSGLTTPGPIELQRVLRALVEAGVTTVAMECSSHALHQRRLYGLPFAAAVYTNLTRDHLDYHGTMEAYRDAKALLLAQLAPRGTAILNADDPMWAGLPAVAPTLRFTMADADVAVRATGLRYRPGGSEWSLVTPEGRFPVTFPLMGDFNVANALAAAGAALALGMPSATIAERLGSVPQVPGRLEVLHEHPTVLRDYAHTPDAYERVLTALRPYTTGRIILVFGCGGDRDRGKRPLMAAVAHRLADRLVITDDNPRTEDPEQIIADTVAPLPPGSFEVIRDRREGIAHALRIADPTADVVLMVGKGPDTYQIYGTTKSPFDEREIVHELLRGSA